MLFALLSLSLSLPCAQEASTPVPGDADRLLEEEMRAALGRLDPDRAGWLSERRSASVETRMKAFTGALAGSVTIEEAATWASDELTYAPLAPHAALDVVFEDATFRVRRGGPAAFDGVPERGASALERALRELAAPWAEVRTSKVKVESVDATEDGFSTALLFHAGGRRASGRPDAREEQLEVTARWHARWLETDEAPILASLALESIEEVVAQGVLLRDATDATFGPLPGFEAPFGERGRGVGWSEGMGRLRSNLDVRLGLPLVGAPSGIAIGDVNGDGYEDVYLCQPGGLPNRLLLHTTDHGLLDASAASGVDFLDFSRSALLLDLDGDGDRDLVVLAGGALELAENDGEGRFTRRVTVPASETTSLAAADYDLDGDLDLYACSYVSPYGTPDEGTRGAATAGIPVPYHDAQNGHPNLLLRNEGEWAFRDVTEAVGLGAANTRFSFAAAWEDYDLDGDPDLYVANDFGRNNLYRNDDGRFVDVAAAAGVEDVSAGMGVSWGDYDGDGWFDLYVSNMYSAAGKRVTGQERFHPGATGEVRRAYRRHSRGNSLFRNLGDGTFADVSEQAGVTMGRWAWGARFCDLNDDGALDILSPNGFLTGEGKDDL